MSTELVWEDAGVLLEAICGGLGDRRCLPDAEDYVLMDEPISDGPDGTGMLSFMSTADFVPVEIARPVGDSDAVVAARIECVSDVDDLEQSGEGEWRSVGRLDIGEGQAVGCDPSRRGLQNDRIVPLPLPAGTYDAEVFYQGNEALGIRLLLAEND